MKAPDTCVFVTLVDHPEEIFGARLLIDSLRAFGGPMQACPVWVFEGNPKQAPCGDLQAPDVHILPLSMPEIRPYYFSRKVVACARAEELCASSIHSLIWVDPNCLIIRPPLLFNLGTGFDAAVRPVHIQNVGLQTNDPIDPFWRGVYDSFGLEDVQFHITSFVDGKRLRAYFNSHAFAIHPHLGLMRTWLRVFTKLINDTVFQQAACQDELHRIFLFQAVLSTLLVTSLDPDRICILPADYNYPYNLHTSVPAENRTATLNELTCLTYEGRSLSPQEVNDIEIREPFQTWLTSHIR